MEYYAGERQKELLPFATAWIELENIKLSEVSQSVKDKYHTISFIGGSNKQNKLISRTEPETWKQGTD